MKLKLIAILASFLLAISGVVAAQDQNAPALDDQPQAQDNPGPSAQDNNGGVARISLIHGDVSTRRGDSGEWSAATMNAPVVAGDRISTGDHSRTELQLDYANVLRLDESAQANIVELDGNSIQVQLGEGRANYTVLKNSNANAEIDTPNVAVHPDRNGGSFAIYAAGDGHTEVIARRGAAEISTPQGSTRLESGQMITVQGTGSETQYKISDAPGRDDFDRWASDRDRVIQKAQSWKHTNGYYTGSEDLDAYGQWKDVPDYGSVWEPTVGPGWAPYRDGQWAWEPGWGWTWVPYEPWGWAPYHYGRWMYVGGAWGWWPGPVYANPYYYPVWAPAYVSFFGFGGGWGVGFGWGWGSIGWLPLGPCDRFYPWWGGYRSRFGVTSITNITNITNINNFNNRGGWGPLHAGTTYSNLRNVVNNPGFRHAVSTVPSNQFGHGRVTVQPVSREMFQNARLANGNLPVVPTRQSTQIGGRPAAASTIRNSAQNQRFFSNTRTPAGTRASFAQEQSRVQDNIRQNSSFGAINGNQANASNARPTANVSNPRIGAPERAANTVTSNSQPRRSGISSEPARSTSNWAWKSAPRLGNTSNVHVAPAPRETTNVGGWQKFTPHVAGEMTSRGPQNESWRAAPSRGPVSEPRTYSSPSRPPLNMRQPIVTSRGDYGRPSYSQPSYGRPSYSQPSYSRPSYGGGGYSAPSRGGYSAPSGGGYSAPSHGGGGYSGGGSHGGGGGGSHGGGSSHGGGGGHHGR
jgi:hypothetical protein